MAVSTTNDRPRTYVRSFWHAHIVARASVHIVSLHLAVILMHICHWPQIQIVLCCIKTAPSPKDEASILISQFLHAVYTNLVLLAGMLLLYFSK